MNDEWNGIFFKRIGYFKNPPMAHNIYDPSPSECEVNEVIASLIYYTGTFSEFLKNSDHSLVEKSGEKN